MKELQGRFAGQVVSILDPKEIGRIKAFAEGAGYSQLPTPWAFPATARFKGEFSVPDIGDNVWIEFENWNPNRPIYSPGYWSEPAGVSEVPGRARGIIGTSNPKGADTTTTAKDVAVSEPTDPFAAIYPKNRVIETSGGHLIEVDDTPGAERIHIYAKGGSFFEFHADGKTVNRSSGSRYVYVQGDDVLHVLQKLNLVGDVELGLRSPEVVIKGDTKVDIDSPIIELGIGALLNLIDTRIVAAHNIHTHPFAGFTPGVGAGTTSVPTATIVASAVSTSNTKAS